MRIALSAIALIGVIASPAFAQSPVPRIGSGNVAGAPSACSQVPPRQSRVAPQPRPHSGQRWPGAKYDANGYYIDPNSPGRW
jgi:hypothetical protein